MASKLAQYSPGYEDERFEHNVSQTFHCIICTNVIKDAVSCTQNEHLFCRSCITQYLMNSQTCPSCMEPLTVDTLSEASRGVKCLLAELKIRCDFFDRGCGKFVELGDLEMHVKNCGFAPAVCPNEGCRIEVNKHDLLHHETAVCNLRRVKCHSCDDIRKEMDMVKQNLATMNKQLERLERIETKGETVKNIVNLVQEQLNNQEESINRFEERNVKTMESLNEIRKLLEKMTPQRTLPTSSHEVQIVDRNETNKVDTDSDRQKLPTDSPEDVTLKIIEVNGYVAHAYEGVTHLPSETKVLKGNTEIVDNATRNLTEESSSKVGREWKELFAVKQHMENNPTVQKQCKNTDIFAREAESDIKESDNKEDLCRKFETNDSPSSWRKPTIIKTDASSAQNYASHYARDIFQPPQLEILHPNRKGKKKGKSPK